jgi:hypothetical protein
MAQMGTICTRRTFAIAAFAEFAADSAINSRQRNVNEKVYRLFLSSYFSYLRGTDGCTYFAFF